MAGLVCGRRTKWAVLVFWLVVAALAGPLAAQLTSVQQNDNSAWLPVGAESTRVTELQRQFQSGDTLPAVIVYERPGGTTPDDLAKAGQDATSVAGIDGLAGQVIGPIPSEDGEALRLVAPLALGAEGWAKIGTVVEEIRHVVDPGGAGLSVWVAGPAGLAADQASAFEGIDGTLLYATLFVVAVILLITYRSPVLWLLPIFTAGVALASSQAVIYLFAKHAGLTVNGQSQGILTVLVFGAGTDYALLLVARYREELRRHEDRHVAMAVALRRAAPAIIASAATVVLGMLCLVFAQMNSTKGLGPVTAIGITVGLLAMITLLPALLVCCGRWIFWPKRPEFGSPEPTVSGAWSRLGTAISRRARPVWIATVLALGVMAVGTVQLNADGLSASDAFVSEPESVAGQEALARHYPAGEGQPVVVIGRAGDAAAIQSAVTATPGIQAVPEPVVAGDLVMVQATLSDLPDTLAAEETVQRVRDAVRPIAGAEVGGPTAANVDMKEATTRDNLVIIPLVLVVVLLILIVLLRAVVAPLVLMGTVVLSFGAALGISTLVFEHVFGFAGTDTSFPLFAFVFLIALGIDYIIFLMTRVREEAVQHGPHRGALIGLAATGGVITSAGMVLAGTFAALATLPIVVFAQIGFTVALGVLLDTLVVRSILVTALNLDLGRHMWWPSRLSAKPSEPASPAPPPPVPPADSPAPEPVEAR